MRTSERGLELIRRFEGFSSKVYICPAGYPTIVYGHVVLDASRFSGGISEEEGQRLLVADVVLVENSMLRLLPVALSQQQWDALASFTYNLGAGRLQMSSLRRRVLEGAHTEVPRELMRWVYAKGRKLPGLVVRRAAEAQLYAEN